MDARINYLLRTFKQPSDQFMASRSFSSLPSNPVLSKHLTNLYSGVILPSLISKNFTPLISTPNFCLIKHQIQRLKVNNQKLNSRIASNILSASKQTSDHSQPAFTCSKLTIETLEQGVKYVQS